MNNYTYDEAVVRAYLAINEGLKLIHHTMKMIARQQAIINKADREIVEELKRRNIPTPENIIGDLK